MFKTKLFSFLSIIAIFSLFAFSNEDLIDKLVAKLEKYTREAPQEKVYLQTDKPYYMAGETIWMKGYLFESRSHSVDSVSRVLYVDLIDQQKGKIIYQRILKCGAGMTHGDIALGDSLTEGMYQLRAYTNYMRNFPESFFFTKDIKIWQGSVKSRADDSKIAEFAKISDLQFLPEGGNLVNGLDSRVAFKAVNIAGKGVDCNGFILENEKDTVGVIKAEHLGMGFFNLTPEAGKTYTAKIMGLDGKYAAFPLPVASEQGYVMAVDNATSKENVKVFVFNSSPKAESSGELVVIAHQRGKVCFVGKGAESKKSFSANIPRSKFTDDGIVQLTLFDAKGNPRAERLIFVSQNRQVNLKVSLDKNSYKTREKVTLSLEATDAEGKPVAGNFSVAVTDGSQVLTDPNQENMLTYLLLGSDIKTSHNPNDYYSILRGNIEQPAYYFDKNNAEASRHLDILMMTHGWRRFTWSDVLAEKYPKFENLLETGLSVTGKVLRPNGKISNNAMMTLMLKPKEGTPIFTMTTGDSLGRYGFYDLDFTDTSSVMVQATKEKGGKNLDVTVDPYSPPMVRIIKSPFNPIEFDARDLALFLKKANEAIELEKKLKLDKNQMLEEVVVRAKKEKPVDNRKIYGRASNSVEVTEQNCVGYQNVFQLLQGKVPGVQVVGNSVIIRGASSFQSSNSPLYVLDGITSDDVGLIQNIPPCDVETIDVLKGAEASIYGSRGANGVISVLTRRGGSNRDYSKDIIPGVITTKKLGYSIAREFYAPKYDVQKQEHVRPDFRSTLQWSPNVKTDANGKATLTFWNTDGIGNMLIIAEGVGANGRVGVGKHEYIVK
jgi:TonB-dependent SusC/RagA subfamily outer membrane receptor